MRTTTVALIVAATLAAAPTSAYAASVEIAPVARVHAMAAGSAAAGASTPAPSATAPSTPVIRTPAPRGAVPIGTASYPAPANAVYVNPTSGNDANNGTLKAPKRTLNHAIKVAPKGGTVVLRGGTYHEGGLHVGKPLTIQNHPGEAAWLDGSRTVGGFTHEGKTWWAPWTKKWDHSASFTVGQTDPEILKGARPIAAWPDLAFRNGVPLQQVMANPGVGQFAVDYDAERLILGENPAGAEIRASDLNKAISVGSTEVTLQGFGIRRYANSIPTMGVVYVARHRTVLRNLHIEDAATLAITQYSDGKNGAGLIENVTIKRAGLCAICSSTADGTILRNNHIDQANYENFNAQPSSAAIKLTRSRNLTIDNNLITNGTRSQGIWLDESIVNFSITNNTVTDAGNAGIEAELSSSGVIAGNVVSGSKYGLYIFDSEKLTIANNTVWNSVVSDLHMSQDFRRQANPAHNGHDPRYPAGDPTNTWILRDLTIHNNVFAADATTSMFQLYVLDKNTNRDANSMNIVVNGNAFTAKGADATAMPIGWGGADNVMVRKYPTWEAFAAAMGKPWKGHTFPATTTVPAMRAAARALTGVAVPLSDALASKLGVAPGTAQVGAFLP